ncbi:peptide chain release factor N(5)-glutamine methyltransferase [Arthrobacter sp. NEB 688]|uniref:peptide chain release factor N(5)-glutamine methyltransferase n=1 Tax=Arthrobacter sp. NEB 688 TaxID=904039 RepID=UPI0015643E10|nr:peptide chain release factor N(5)-glutamine methyltransferase [Arthrobacter sp. NEB 688]QKE84087.1 peptide chain release factor N(5)-glutamine methyltransferase [Arthrobacter sp. NEB 688]
MTTTDALLARGRTALSGAGVGSPDADAVELLSHVLGVDHGEVRMRGILRTPVVERDAARFDDLVEDRCARVPLQHLTGRAYFRHLTLAVGSGVFVPRPETELTAGHAIEAARAAGEAPVVVDLCTGSGAIALAVADEVPGARVHAVELGPPAHAWAAQNVERLGLPVDLRLGDATTAFEDLEAAVDVVVSNPPYIPDGAVPVDPEVRDHDPALALYGRSADGLAVPLAVARRAAALLREGGVLVMEHADEQGESLPTALRATGEWRDVVDHRDLAGRPRTTVAVRAGRA